MRFHGRCWRSRSRPRSSCRPPHTSCSITDDASTLPGNTPPAPGTESFLHRPCPRNMGNRTQKTHRWTLTVGEQDDDVVLAFLCKQHPTADLFQPKTYLPWRPETNTPRLLARPAFATHSSPCPPPRAFRPGRDRDAGNGGPHGPDYHRRHSTTADARGCARSSAHTVARYRHAAEHATARTKSTCSPGPERPPTARWALATTDPVRSGADLHFLQPSADEDAPPNARPWR